MPGLPVLIASGFDTAALLDTSAYMAGAGLVTIGLAIGMLAVTTVLVYQSALEVSGAHLYEQARRDAFNRLSARDALMVDAEPERLGVELVNRYQAVKKGGLI